MNKIDFKKVIGELIEKNKISPESKAVVLKYKQAISSCNIETITSEMTSNHVIEIYTRREKSLSINAIEHYGLTETLHSIKRQASSVKIGHGIYQNYNLIIFVDANYQSLLGVVILKKNTEIDDD